MMKRKLQQSELISTVEAGKILGFSKDTVRRWAQAGKIPHVQFPSGQIKFYREDIEAMLIPKLIPSLSNTPSSVAIQQESSDVPFPGFEGE